MQDSQIVFEMLVKNAGETERTLGRIEAALKRLETATNKSTGATNKSTEATKRKAKATGQVAVTSTGAAQAEEKLASSTNKSANSTNRASKAHESYFLHIAKTTVQSALINKIFLEMADVVGQAVQAVDLMANFPATMASMGQSTQDAAVAMDALRAYVGQVGGNIQQATSYVTRFTGVTKDVKAATAVYTGLNNALIAGDSSAEEQRQAMLQFAQAFERGRPDMREWNSLSTNMSFQLQQVAKQMGYINSNALGQALRDGEESMAAFTTTLTEMSTGTGVIAKQAMTRMQGMQFAFNVLKNTMVTGLATIVQAIGRNTIVSFFTFLTQTAIAAAQGVVFLINALISLFNILSRLVGGPQLNPIQADAEAAAKGIAGAAGAAGDLGDGLKGAKDDAKELNKSLAAFDKMNVLDKGKTPKEKEDKTPKGTTFDAGQLDKLGNSFDDIGKKLQEVGLAAKIFAGVLGALALLKPFVNLITGLSDLNKGLKEGATGTDKFSKKLGGLGKILKDAFKGETAVKEAAQGGKTVGYGFLSGLGAAIGSGLGTIGRFIIPLLAGAGVAILAAFENFILIPLITVVGAVAVTLGVPFEVAALIIAAVVAAIVGIIWLIWTNWDKIWKFMVDVFNGAVGIIKGVWSTLYDIFAKPIGDFLNFWKSVFILIVALVVIALEAIVKGWVDSINTIFNFLKVIPGWINTNVIQPVVSFFKTLWDGVVFITTTAWNFIFNNILKPIAGLINTFVIQPILNFFTGLWNGITAVTTAAWNFIFTNILRPIGGWINTNVIQPVFSIFQGLWNSVSGVTGGFVNTVLNIIGGIVGWIHGNVINPVAGLFQGLWNGVRTGLDNLFNGIRNVFGNLGNIIKAPINAVIDAWNGMIKSLNNIKIPGTNISPTFTPLNRLAAGGVVTTPTTALIGESGSEAIVPLEQNTEWIDKLAAKINSASSTSNNQPIAVTIQIGEDKIATKIIDLINEKTQMSGRNAIVV